MATEVEPESVSVSLRRLDTGSEEVRPWSTVELDALGSASPWRVFRWHKGQKHYSGVYWSATERDHVIYESRLELARLLFADFDVSVRHIVAQPFLLKAKVAGAVRKHIPDYLLFTDTVPIVVDVKPRRRLVTPENVFTCAWTKRAVESRGWRYEMWSEPPRAELENVRFLAGYRRDWLFDTDVLEEVRATGVDGAMLGQLCQRFPGHPESQVRSVVLHLLWQQYFVVDLTRVLSQAHVVRRAR